MKTRSFLGWFGRTPRSEVKASAEARVAEREDAESQYKQGQRFERGAGVSQDEARAVGYYLKAGVQGHAAAPFNLGLMCVQGTGVSRKGQRPTVAAPGGGTGPPRRAIPFGRDPVPRQQALAGRAGIRSTH